MARGRGGANGGGLAAAALLIIGLLVTVTTAPLAEAAASHMVGDYGGWKFNVDRWAKGRTFRAGDELGKYYYSTSTMSRQAAPIRPLSGSLPCITRLRAQCSGTTGRCTMWRWWTRRRTGAAWCPGAPGFCGAGATR